MNQCDGWPSKGIPLEMKAEVKKEKREGEMGKIVA